VFLTELSSGSKSLFGTLHEDNHRAKKTEVISLKFMVQSLFLKVFYI